MRVTPQQAASAAAVPVKMQKGRRGVKRGACREGREGRVRKGGVARAVASREQAERSNSSTVGLGRAAAYCKRLARLRHRTEQLRHRLGLCGLCEADVRLVDHHAPYVLQPEVAADARAREVLGRAHDDVHSLEHVLRMCMARVRMVRVRMVARVRAHGYAACGQCSACACAWATVAPTGHGLRMHMHMHMHMAPTAFARTRSGPSPDPRRRRGTAHPTRRQPVKVKRRKAYE